MTSVARLTWIPLLLLLCLFGGSQIVYNFNTTKIYGFVLFIIHSRSTQWIVIATCAFYLFLFSLFRFPHASAIKFPRMNSGMAFSFLLGSLLLSYGITNPATRDSTALVILLVSALVGAGLSIYCTRGKNPGSNYLLSTKSLAAILAGCAFLNEQPGSHYLYIGQLRWSGPWGNPNIFGILMGVGTVLATGHYLHAVFGTPCKTGSEKYEAQKDKKQYESICRNKTFKIIFDREPFQQCVWTAVATICGYGLIKSYSRGAMIATVVGGGYLLFSASHAFRKAKTFGLYISKLRNNWIPLALICASLSILCFWQFRYTEWPPARRLFSISNINDFSWRNRITAWKGALSLMREQPWFGYGWGGAESAYNKKYLPKQIENGAAIQMNDYAILALSSGIPALVCFLIYVSMSLSPPLSAAYSMTGGEANLTFKQSALVSDLSLVFWTTALSRAGAIVLLVGFFFDGGLFKFATSSLFWILLEFGQPSYCSSDPKVLKPIASVKISIAESVSPVTENTGVPTASHPWGQSSILLRRLAWALGIVAFAETGILLSLPFLQINNTTLAISRRYLIPQSAIPDLNLLATNVAWGDRKLARLLENASLANYNRQLLNWKLDPQIYTDDVLNPLIDSQRDRQLNWRRDLWEYFYLPVRKENESRRAAQIVLRHLRDQIQIVPHGPMTVEDMWRQKQADKRGLEALKVAAFRSVGIPARLGDDGAQFYADGKWQPAL